MKTRRCSPGDARKRLTAARKFLEVAELYLNDSELEGRRVAVSNAVHAGIAAADSICCALLGQHALGDDHQSAVKLLAGTGPRAAAPARALGALLRVKSKAQYQTATIGKADATAAVRRAATPGRGSGEDHPLGDLRRPCRNRGPARCASLPAW